MGFIINTTALSAHKYSPHQIRKRGESSTPSRLCAILEVGKWPFQNLTRQIYVNGSEDRERGREEAGKNLIYVR